MKKLKILKTGLCFLLVIAWGLPGYSQKLKSVEEGSVWAPAKVEVDGNLNEWGDTFQAYNPATSVDYTLSNDNKYLYLAIKSDDQANSNKIAAGGIDLTINTADKKNEKNAFEIIYPMPNPELTRSVMPRRGRAGGGGATNPFALDSATLATIHHAAIEGAKEIKLVGFKDIPDSVISIYNVYGFKAAIGYDAKGDLTYEAAIPLKSLGLSPANAKQFAYNIKINPIQFPNRGGRGNGERGGYGEGGGGGFGGGGFGGGRGGFGGGGGGFGGGGRGGNGGRDFGGPPNDAAFATLQNMMTATDFWGKYKLATVK